MEYSRRKGLWASALLLGAMIAAPAMLLAGAEARLSGKVTDPNGKPLASVKATLKSEASGKTMTRTTDRKGRFAFLVIDATHPPYSLTLEKEGYEKLSGPIQLKVGGTARKEFTMPPAQAAEPEAPEAVKGDSAAVKLFNEGATLYNSGDVDGAIAKFEAAVETKPDLTQALSLLSGLYADRGDYEKSLDYANRILQVEPQNSQALLGRYDALVALGRNDEAEKALDAAIAVAPPAEVAKRVYNRGARAQRAGDRDGAIAQFARAVELDPTMAPALSALAGMYLTQKDYEKAVSTAEQLLQIKPGDAEALTIQYEAYKGLGDKAKADATYAQLQQSAGGDPEALYRKGVALFNNSNFDGAIEALKQAIAVKPDLAGAHYTLGLALLNQGDNAGAKAELQRFLELAPKDPNAGSAKQMLDYLSKK
jgi:tetratricopeptide (TPR) repeat protein